MIEVNYNEYKETIVQNMKLIVENHDLKQEIERLNNNWNELEQWLEKEYDNQKYYGEDVWLLDMVMDKIKELKGE